MVQEGAATCWCTVMIVLLWMLGSCPYPHMVVFRPVSGRRARGCFCPYDLRITIYGSTSPGVATEYAFQGRIIAGKDPNLQR
jgi:hypothetical protein